MLSALSAFSIFPLKPSWSVPRLEPVLQARTQTPGDFESSRLEGIFKDLPRTTHPFTGKDDTETIWKRVVTARPELPYYPDQTNPRRKLYLAICELRKTGAWLGDATSAAAAVA